MRENSTDNMIYSVLVMDDNPERALLESLAARGIRATVSKDKKSAQKLLDQSRFNIIFISSCFEWFLHGKQPSLVLVEI